MEPDAAPTADGTEPPAEREELRRSGVAGDAGTPGEAGREELRRSGGEEPTRTQTGRPEPDKVEPLQVNMTRVVLAGIIAWAVALVVLLVLHSTLAAHGNTWWIWTCVVAIGLGGIGLLVVRRR